jgi:cytochrome c-type biogenesis protein CcmF
MIQEKRGMLKAWNLFLIIISFLLVVLGTFSTRSGFVASVHSFAESPIGGVMLGFVSVMVLGCLGLWAWRFRRGELTSDHRLSALISRESMFVLNNWIIMSITLAVFWGTYAPVFSQALLGNAITLGAGYFQLVVVPLFGVLYVLMGVAPLVAWKKSTIGALGQSIRVPVALTALTVVILFLAGMRNLGGFIGYGLLSFAGYTMLFEFYRGARARIRHGENPLTALFKLFQRDRRRYGGYFIHLGIVVIGIGAFTSTAYQQQTEQTINPGDKITLGNMSLVYKDIFQATADDGRQMTIANVAVYRDNEYLGDIRPRRDVFQDSLTPMTIAGQYSTLGSDFYVILADWAGYRATFKVFLNPLVDLIWSGGIVLVIGTLIAGWPSRALEIAERAAEGHSPDKLELVVD